MPGNVNRKKFSHRQKTSAKEKDFFLSNKVKTPDL
jgi:hypothetical protein